MAVVLSDLLDEKCVALELKALTQEEALREIIALADVQDRLPDAGGFLRAVLARERTSSTAAGHGVAFPHARTNALQRIVLGIGRSRAGIHFDDAGELVHLIFLIGVPQQMIQDYLVCVGALARLVKDDAMRARLLAAQTPEEFVAGLRAASLLLK